MKSPKTGGIRGKKWMYDHLQGHGSGLSLRHVNDKIQIARPSPNFIRRSQFCNVHGFSPSSPQDVFSGLCHLSALRVQQRLVRLVVEVVVMVVVKTVLFTGIVGMVNVAQHRILVRAV